MHTRHNSPFRFILFTVLGASLLVAGCYSYVNLAQPNAATADRSLVSGIVLGEDGPFAGAQVRVQTTENVVMTDANGAFRLTGLTPGKPAILVAWADGHFFGWEEVTPGAGEITLRMARHPNTDNLDYEWEPSSNCGECHTAYDEWLGDAHGRSAANLRFQSMYNGTDIFGNRGLNTNYDAGFPKEIDLSEPYFGPGFKLDYPQRDGNCAACHTPMASNLETKSGCGWNGCHMDTTAERSDEIEAGISPVALTGVANEGISCDFCHKIGDVLLDPETQLPDKEAPGIVSLALYRPAPGERFFMGTIDDVNRVTDSYNPLHKESAYCAACHYGQFSDELIYNSYGEWLESPYSDPETGQSCVDCHMPVAEPYSTGVAAALEAADWMTERTGADLSGPLAGVLAAGDKNYFVFPEKEGLFRDREQVHVHRMPGAADASFLQDAVAMNTDAQRLDDSLSVAVTITNQGAGHHLPTGSPLRHMILNVRVLDEQGNLLTRRSGPLLPDWTGDYAGRTGKAFAKILTDEISGESPTAAHWRDVVVEEDTRIPALAGDRSEYTFDAPASGDIVIETELIFRRAFQDLADWKGWDDPDIVMAENRTIVPVPK